MNPEIHSMENGKITILAPAKINLYFGVTGMRSDGYHEVETVLQSVNLFDRLTVSASEGNGREVSVLCRELSDVPESENIAYKAAQAYLSAAEEDNIKVEIPIEKKIPDGAGFGGGSSDAAAVIIALNTLSGDRFSLAELFEIGATVGADVPFCIKKGTVKATGFGEVLESCAPMPDCCIVLAVPNGEKVSTAQAYAAMDDAGYPSEIGAMLSALSECDIKKIASAMKNDFERVQEDGCASAQLKEKLLSLGAVAAMLSGSGAGVFGIFDSVKAAKAAKEALDDEAKVFVCAPARRDYAYVEK